jgi:PucR-like helix-turn-helix protein
MTNNLDSEPWRGLPPAVADLIEPELAPITAEILESIGREVPEYSRPLEGRFGRGVRTGVGEALRQFVALIREPDAGRELGREVYVGLGRGELRQGRTLDSLQAAYRVGARVAWRRIAAAGRRAELDPEALGLLAEAIFAYIDELSADSVEGFAAAQSENEELRARRRHELTGLMMRDPPPALDDVRAAARAAGWKLPRQLAALACAEEELAAVLRRLPVDALATSFEEVGCVLVADPGGPGRAKEIERAARGRLVALGPICDPAGARISWRIAKLGLAAMSAGVITGDGVLVADDHLADLLLFEGAALVERIARRHLVPFDSLTDKARARMEETALAYLTHHANAVEMAKALHLHPQTVRYRIARLRELLPDRLDDPDTRFELEIGLRARSRAQRRRLRGNVLNTASQIGEETPNP